MKLILFTKMFKGQPVEGLIETIHAVGAEGADLCVREGYPVSPANARAELPKAVRRFQEAGLAVPMVTASTGLTDPSTQEAETLFAACHDAGVPHVKVGYWPYKGPDYWKQVDSARTDIEGFEKLASRFGVQACLHTHSGANLGLNASSAMHLARGLAPGSIGLYLDPGHLSLCGEPPHMAVSIAGEYLSLLAVKDPRWIMEPGKRPRAEFGPVGEGLVDWAGVVQALRDRDYQGPLTFHSEYDHLKGQDLVDQTRRDIRYFRSVMDKKG